MQADTVLAGLVEEDTDSVVPAEVGIESADPAEQAGIDLAEEDTALVAEEQEGIGSDDPEEDTDPADPAAERAGIDPVGSAEEDTALVAEQEKEEEDTASAVQADTVLAGLVEDTESVVPAEWAGIDLADPAAEEQEDTESVDPAERADIDLAEVDTVLVEVEEEADTVLVEVGEEEADTDLVVLVDPEEDTDPAAAVEEQAGIATVPVEQTGIDLAAEQEDTVPAAVEEQAGIATVPVEEQAGIATVPVEEEAGIDLAAEQEKEEEDTGPAVQADTDLVVLVDPEEDTEPAAVEEQAGIAPAEEEQEKDTDPAVLVDPEADTDPGQAGIVLAEQEQGQEMEEDTVLADRDTEPAEEQEKEQAGTVPVDPEDTEPAGTGEETASRRHCFLQHRWDRDSSTLPSRKADSALFPQTGHPCGKRGEWVDSRPSRSAQSWRRCPRSCGTWCRYTPSSSSVPDSHRGTSQRSAFRSTESFLTGDS